MRSGDMAASIAWADRFGTSLVVVRLSPIKGKSTFFRSLARPAGSQPGQLRVLRCAPPLARFRAVPGGLRRDGRAVEGARLESAYTAKNRIVGSNPTPSANQIYIY